MWKGNLSNFVDDTIGFACVDFLVLPKRDTLLDRMIASFAKFHKAKLDQQVLKAIEYVYRKTPMTVDIIVDPKDDCPQLRELLDEVSCGRIVIAKPSEISRRLYTGDLTWYVDDVEYRRGLVSNSHAINLSALESMISTIKGGNKR